MHRILTLIILSLITFQSLKSETNNSSAVKK